MNKLLTILFSLLFVSCAVTETYTDIVITSQGNSLENTKLMKEVCKQFKLSEDQVLSYFQEATRTDESTIHNQHDILPCSSRGEIKISGIEYSWIIRAGGVGEYFNDTKKVLLVCEDKCCKITKGIC